MPKQIVSLSSAPTVGVTPGQSVSPLAQAIRFGNMLFVSGQGSVDPATGSVIEDDIAVRTHLALDNPMSVLAAVGATAKNFIPLKNFGSVSRHYQNLIKLI
jgi:2-iminobutanoate/2-iminopropanoate deaminase